MLRRSTAHLSDDAAVQRRLQYAKLEASCRAIVEGVVDRVVDATAAAQYHQAQELVAEITGAGLLGELPLSFGAKPRPAESHPPRRKRQAAKKKKKRAPNANGAARAAEDDEEGATGAGVLPYDEEETSAGVVSYAEASADALSAGLACVCFWSGDHGWYPAVVHTPCEPGAETCAVCFGGSDVAVEVPVAWIRLRIEGAGVDSGWEQQAAATAASEAGLESPGAASEERGPLAVKGGSDEARAPSPVDTPCHTPPSAMSTSAVVVPKPKRRGPARPRANWSGPDAKNPNPNVPDKYWAQRYRLFSLFDQGVLLDAESWFSATPEAIARHTAVRCRCDVLLDPFCGVGGNVLQFAQTCHRVIAIDLDPNKIAQARHNARLYGVEDRIEFIVGDALAVMASWRRGSIDVVYLSPPWGGPSYLDAAEFDLKAMVSLNGGAVDGEQLFAAARRLTRHVAYFLPRTTPPEALAALEAEPSTVVEVEDHVLNGKLKTRIGYYGDLAQGGER